MAAFFWLHIRDYSGHLQNISLHNDLVLFILNDYTLLYTQQSKGG